MRQEQGCGTETCGKIGGARVPGENLTNIVRRFWKEMSRTQEGPRVRHLLLQTPEKPGEPSFIEAYRKILLLRWKNSSDPGLLRPSQILHLRVVAVAATVPLAFTVMNRQVSRVQQDIEGDALALHGSAYEHMPPGVVPGMNPVIVTLGPGPENRIALLRVSADKKLPLPLKKRGCPRSPVSEPPSK